MLKVFHGKIQHDVGMSWSLLNEWNKREFWSNKKLVKYEMIDHSELRFMHIIASVENYLNNMQRLCFNLNCYSNEDMELEYDCFRFTHSSAVRMLNWVHILKEK